MNQMQGLLPRICVLSVPSADVIAKISQLHEMFSAVACKSRDSSNTSNGLNEVNCSVRGKTLN